MKPLRLLLVDDDPGLRALLRATFEVVDMDVAEAESAEEAAELCASIAELVRREARDR